MRTLALEVQALGCIESNSAGLLTVWTMHLHLKCRPLAALEVTMQSGGENGQCTYIKVR